MSNEKLSSLVLKIGLPLVVSMILQAIYNVVDTMFVINMSIDGVKGNLALSACFPVQILMIAIGVGTGVGINAMISKNLGTRNYDKVSKVAGNGLFLSLIFYVIFLIFGLFFTEQYMSMMSDDSRVIEMGSQYLTICCTLSIGSLMYSVVERFLMASSLTIYSMIAQLSGAIFNIVFDYVFIYPCGMGIQGAALATVLGQILSLVLGFIFHFVKNRDIKLNFKSLIPDFKTILEIYKIGFPAFLMQAMLSLMMFFVLLILNTRVEYKEILTGSFGIYYKMMQVPLFAAFGLSNALISLVSFNYGRGDYDRVKECAKWGIIYSAILLAILTILYQIFASQISSLFALSNSDSESKNELISVCTYSLHIASIGYIFMGVSVGIQGVLQGLNKVYTPIIISSLRLLVFVLPFSYLLIQFSDPSHQFYFTFIISEVLTCLISIFIFYFEMKHTLKSDF